jgi:hypothetical protein
MLARRIKNIVGIDASDDMTDGWWSKLGATVVVVDATHLTIPTVAPPSHGIYNTTPLTDTVSECSFSVVVSGTGNFRLWVGTGAPSTNITATGTPLRYAMNGVADDGFVGLSRQSGTPLEDAVLTITDWQVETVEKQANQNPGGRVSTMAAVDHGSGVSGVKYFNLDNGNTVTDYIVDEVEGASITDSIRGYLAEQSKEQLLFPSEDLTDILWTANQNNIIPANDGLIAGISANSIQADSTSDVIHSAQYGISVENQDFTVSFFVSSGTATHAFIKATRNIGGTTAEQFFNLSTGELGSTGGGGGSLTIVSGSAMIDVVKGGFLVHLVFNQTAGAPGAHRIEFGISDADGSTNYAAATGVDLCHMTGMQAQRDHEVGEYIPSTTGTVTTVGDILEIPIANMPDETFSVLLWVYLETAIISNSTMIAFRKITGNEPEYALDFQGGNFRARQWSDTPSVVVYNAVSSAAPAGASKVAVTFSRSAGARFMAVNGVSFAASKDDNDASSWDIERIDIGCYIVSGASQPDIPISNIQFYEPLSASQLMALTAI